FCAGIFNGTTSIEFLTTLVLAGIVSYDAMHMRAEFHRQGLLLKEVAVKTLGKEYVDKRCPNMNEFQGHEMVEVVAGLALGVVVSAIVLNL
ncbi:MAG TPA: divergent PAP2 family protein, partial [Bacillota bacterium]|nr:divergent PAP2 family protein [Bacillota bacterium]